MRTAHVVASSETPVKAAARLLVVDDAGRWVGAIGPFPCGPHAQECSELVAAARSAGIAVTVLRLAAQISQGDTVERRYVVQALHPVRSSSLEPLPDSLPDETKFVPRRRRYARAGGVVEDVRWAADALRRRGRRMRGWPEQIRSWNLSCVHRVLQDDGGSAWLKVVPPFFRHEAALLRFMADSSCGIRVPVLLDHHPGARRLLLDDVPGALMWGASVDDWLDAVRCHVEAQFQLRDRVDPLRRLGAADWCGPAFGRAVRHLLRREDVRATLSRETLAVLDEQVSKLEVLVRLIAECRLPDSLVHGDFHRGNVIQCAAGVQEPDGSLDAARVVLDWGDAGVGNPLFDVPAMCHGWSESEAERIRACVVQSWQTLVPHSDAAAAMAAMAPLMALRQAIVYRGFLDGIEVAEHHYHDADVPAQLAVAARESRA